MPPPSINTPVDKLVIIVRVLQDWFAKHTEVLEFVFGSDFDGASQSKRLADELETAESNYRRERRENTEVTAQRRQAIRNVQNFISSLIALVKVAFQDQPVDLVDNTLKDFVSNPPSSIRSEPNCLRALRIAESGIEKYRARLDEPIPRAELLINRSKELTEEIGKLTKDQVREAQETRDAKVSRDEASAAVLRFIRTAVLAAEAVQFQDEKPLEDIHAVFETHNPPSNVSVAETELPEDIIPETPEEPTPPDV